MTNFGDMVSTNILYLSNAFCFASICLHLTLVLFVISEQIFHFQKAVSTLVVQAVLRSVLLTLQTNLLLLHHADPIMATKEQKTPLDLACEFGRYRVSVIRCTSKSPRKLLFSNTIKNKSSFAKSSAIFFLLHTRQIQHSSLFHHQVATKQNCDHGN